jgi:hypothetical protein
MVVQYKDRGMGQLADCLLCSVDFDAELLKLIPFDDVHQEKTFYGAIQYCSLPKRGMKAVSLNGNKIKEKTGDELRKDLIGVYIEDDSDLDDAS